MTSPDYSVRDRAFDSVKGLIYQKLLRWINRQGGEVDELYNQFWLKWARAYPKYDPARSKLTTWTGTVLDNFLRDVDKARRSGFRRLFGELRHDPAAPECVSVAEELTGDALFIASLIREPSEEVLALRTTSGMGGLWCAVRKYLKRTLGWSQERIDEARAEGGCV